MPSSADREAAAAAGAAWEAMRALVLGNLRRRDVCRALDLSFARVKVLLQLTERPATVGALAAELGMDATYVSVLVHDLERRGLLTRHADPDDRRRRQLGLTVEGAAAAERAATMLATPPDALLALPAAELSRLAARLEEVAARAGEAGADGGVHNGGAGADGRVGPPTEPTDRTGCIDHEEPSRP